MAVFRRDALRGFIDELAQRLREDHPSKTANLSDAAMRDLVWHGIERASRYGIVLGEDAARFVEYAVRYGRDFDRDPALPWVISTLANPGLEGSEKMRRLEAQHRARRARREKPQRAR